jgi:preprotein translocase subunit SecG
MQFLNIIHVLVAIAMCAFILVQRGPGATAGAAFGSGASGTVFGSRGAGSFLSRSTWVLAALFCLISLVMAVIVSRDLSAPETDLGVIGTVTTEETTEQPFPSMDDPTSDVPVLTPGIEGSDVGSAAPASDVPAMDAVPAEEEEQPTEADPDGTLR